MYKIIFLFLFLTILFLFIIPTIWCYDPTLLVNLNYKKNLNISEFEDKPCLFIANCNDFPYHHLDQIIVCREAIDTKIKLNIISWYNEADIITRTMKKFPLFAKYNLIYTKDNTIEKCKEKLKTEHVWMFLKEEWKTNGAYHILKDLNIPIIFVKITPIDKKEKEEKLIKNTFNRVYEIEYTKLENYDINKTPEDFTKFIKNKLYNSKLEN